MRSTFVVLLLALGVIGAPVSILAQADSTPAALAPQRYFPDREQLGEGWLMRQSYTTTEDLDTTVFQTFSKRRYGGPGGARAALDVRPLVDRPGAMLRGWAMMTDAFESWSFDYEGGYASRRDLATMPPPEGCLDAQRITGIDDNGYPVAVTMCATEDVILVAFFSGEMPYKQGPETSDQLIAWALEAAAA